MKRWLGLSPLCLLAPVAAAQHAGHQMPPAAPPTTGAATPDSAPPEPGPPPVPATAAADAVYGRATMDRARAILRREHGGARFSKVLFDLAEIEAGAGRDAYRWDAQAWFGGDIDKFVVKSEGQGDLGRTPDGAEVQVLYGHAIGPYFDLQAGFRYDLRPDPGRGYAVLGVEGLAPYWFEVEAHAFVSTQGEVFARLKVEHDVLLTQRLILQPRAEVDIALQDVPAIGAGRGVQDLELGLRLRYELAREVAPYIGLDHERLSGATRRFAHAAGNGASRTRMVFGVRAWF